MLVFAAIFGWLALLAALVLLRVANRKLDETIRMLEGMQSSRRVARAARTYFAEFDYMLGPWRPPHDYPERRDLRDALREEADRG